MTPEETIKKTITDNDVVLFMKGTREKPGCGFSGRLGSLLSFLDLTFEDVDVLADETLLEGLEVFSNLPFVPQLYLQGELVGGCDRVMEMILSGELDRLLDDKGVAFSREAAEKMRAANA